ncbi:MAG: transketolase [Bacteroidetes bacterium]|nr:MAG: transketolase [Bacteroidota bacterium]
MVTAQMAEETLAAYKQEVINDYKVAFQSRQASLIGRKEVLTGKAKFGIFGDGKEVAQLAMAKAFKKGDFRSGYYRDQTFMFALGMSNVREFFAQLYAHTSVEAEPCSAGRSMNGHFGTRLLNPDGSWKSQTDRYNSSADISPTGGQMPRLLGLAMASKVYRENKELQSHTDFSINGNEVAFGTIGNASTSEGMFWEAINAACVMQVPMAMSIWDDQYGISVPAKYQTAKENLSSILSGFQTDEHGKGLQLFTAKGWDYAELCLTYQKAVAVCREEHTPVVIHVTEVTQPQGHSTSGSHERYKSKERLEWEQEFDCIKKMREWMEANAIATAEELDTLENDWKKEVNAEKKAAWEAYLGDIKADVAEAGVLLDDLAAQSSNGAAIAEVAANLRAISEPMRKDVGVALNTALRLTLHENGPARQAVAEHKKQFTADNYERYSTYLHSESEWNALKVQEVKPIYGADAKMMDGREVLQAYFDSAITRDPRVFAFGEDVGKIGDVNQGFAGLQEKHGENRVFDTGIRECTIIGQGIGAAMRGLRPIAEIQYLDYLLYAIQIMSDDLATVQWRTKGGQKAPLIVRTRGHRLEGIWHSGSPMGMIINSLRGMYVCVPRNMTQAAGMYNTLLQSDEPGLIVECLNGYRLKEQMPDNIADITVPLGVPETLIEGDDVTLVTYGSSTRIAEDAIKQLNEVGISVELIDVQTLLPFDIHHKIIESVKKTNRVVFLDEDVPGGASAYMFQQVMEGQQAFKWLDSEPRTISAQPHRPAYGTDGDYFSKPGAETVFEVIYEMMHEVDPGSYPKFA